MIHACPPTMPPRRLISRDRSFSHLFDSSDSEQTFNVCDSSIVAVMNAFRSIQAELAPEMHAFI